MFFFVFFLHVVAIEIELLSSQINQALRPLTSNPRLLYSLRVQYIRRSESVKSKENIQSNLPTADAGNSVDRILRAAGGLAANHQD